MVSACPAGCLLPGSCPASRTPRSWHRKAGCFEVWSPLPARRLGLSGAGLGGAPLWLFWAPRQSLCSWGARAPLCPLAFQKQTEGWRVGTRGLSRLPGPGRVLCSVATTPRSSLAGVPATQREADEGRPTPVPWEPGQRQHLLVLGPGSSLRPPGLVPALHAPRAPVRRSLGVSLEWGLCGAGPEGGSDAPQALGVSLSGGGVGGLGPRPS